MKIIGNGRLLTRNENQPYLDDGAVAFDGTTIVAVGDTTAIKGQYPEAEFLDAKGGVIMPGFINMHNHIYSAFARGLTIEGVGPNRNFLEVLENHWWKIDRTMTLEDTYYSAVATYLDCIKSGVTTIFDHHASFGSVEGSLFEIGRAATEFGVRSNLCYEISDRDGKEKAKASVDENVAFINHTKTLDGDMLKGMVGMHASFTIQDETMAYMREVTPEGVGYHVHVAEGLDDVYDSLKRYGKRVVNRLFDWDILGEKTLAVHCVHIDPIEMQLLKDTNTMVAHNPESNMGNAIGCPPVIEMMHRGITLGLGTDGYTNDMTESYKVANILHKHNLADPTTAWVEIPEALFDNNPAMANRYFDTPLGKLEQGAAADIIVIDYDPLTPMNGGNANSHILFGMNGRSVKTTIINGEVKMLDREVIGVDEAQVMAKVREQASDMWKRVNA